MTENNNYKTDKNKIFEAEHITYVYGEGTPFRHVALDDVSFSVYENELIGIIGHTGSGKSTLMQHFNALLKPTSGRVLLHGEDINASKKSAHRARFTVGLVMQYPENQLFEETVYKDIAFGPINKGLRGEELDGVVRRSADAVGLRRELLESSPFDLSGGEKRRVAIAGIIAMEPEVLILDEPNAGLDPAGKKDIMSFIKDYQMKSKKTVILVSHNMDTIASVCSRIIVMNKSKIFFDGLPEEIFERHDELRSIGLSPPELTEIFVYMNKHGLPISKAVYTMDYAVRKLLELVGKNGGENDA